MFHIWVHVETTFICKHFRLYWIPLLTQTSLYRLDIALEDKPLESNQFNK